MAEIVDGERQSDRGEKHRAESSSGERGSNGLDGVGQGNKRKAQQNARIKRALSVNVNEGMEPGSC